MSPCFGEQRTDQENREGACFPGIIGPVTGDLLPDIAAAVINGSSEKEIINILTGAGRLCLSHLIVFHGFAANKAF
jgi:hypothetical protein